LPHRLFKRLCLSLSFSPSPLCLSPNPQPPKSNIEIITVTLKRENDETPYGFSTMTDSGDTYINEVEKGIAAAAGLWHGDEVFKVNGADVIGMDHDGIVELLKGVLEVEVVVKREGLVDPQVAGFEWGGRAVAQLKGGKIKGCPVTRDVETGRLIVELGAAWKGKTITSNIIDFLV